MPMNQTIDDMEYVNILDMKSTNRKETSTNEFTYRNSNTVLEIKEPLVMGQPVNSQQTEGNNGVGQSVAPQQTENNPLDVAQGVSPTVNPLPVDSQQR